MKKRNTKIDVKCKICFKEFQAWAYHYNKGYSRHCSDVCAEITRSRKRKLKKKKPNIVCSYPGCDNMFYRSPSQITKSKSGLLFCSRRCHFEARKIKLSAKMIPKHYYSSKTLYREKAYKAFPNLCDMCGIDDQRVLIVHHKDKDRTNNDISNLQILCANCHMIVHYHTD